MTADISTGAIVGIAIGSYIAFALVLHRVIPPRWSDDAVRGTLKARFPYSLRHISHRGGSLHAPENTLLAFERAIVDASTDMLEMDVNISADGVPIVSHDLGLERICDEPFRSLLVSDLVVGADADASLPPLKNVIPLHFASSAKGEAYDALRTPDPTAVAPTRSNTRLCLLREVFVKFPRTPIHLDIKAPSVELTDKVVDMIEEFGREEITVLGTAGANKEAIAAALLRPPKKTAVVQDPTSSSSSPLVAATRRQKYRLFATLGQVAMTYALYYVGLLPLVPLDFDMFSIPMPTTTKGEMFSRFLGRVQSKILGFLLYAPGLWRHLQRRGIAVVGWVLNDRDEYFEVSQWPINGIMTDDPVGLRQFYDQHMTSGMLLW